jgi:hypothetical protein
MCERDAHLHAGPFRGSRGPAVQDHPGGLAGIDLDVAQREPVQTERLHHRLLGREAGSQVPARPCSRRRVGELIVGEDAAGEAGMAVERALEPLDLQQVDSDPGRDPATRFASR